MGNSDQATPNVPGWMKATDAEQNGADCAHMVHSFWATLREKTPKMPAALVEQLTDTFVDALMSGEPGEEDAGA